MHDKFRELSDLKERFIKIVCTQLDCGVEKIDTHELGEVVDMIKDLAEAEEKCTKTKYYESIVEAMDEYEEDPDEYMHEGRMGYNPNRGKSGRYTRSGGDRTRTTSMRMGYPNEPRRTMPTYPGSDDTQPYMDHEDMRYGTPYNQYKVYKRNYTTTKSPTDKAEMDKHAMEHMQDTVATIKDIWHDSDPELKRKMKADFSKLLNEMN